MKRQRSRRLTCRYSLEVTLGKFKPHFTKVNLLHPHAFSFVDFPSMLTRYFSDEGLFMEGVSASWLVPNPSEFYQELDVEIGRSETNNTLDQGNADKLTYVGHLKNFFELTDNATLEFGLSGLSGVNGEQFATTMGGIDITYKWKPVQFNTFQSFTWQTEAIVCQTSTLAASNVQTYGAYSFVEYQIEKRTFLGAQYDYSALPGNKSNEAPRLLAPTYASSRRNFRYSRWNFNTTTAVTRTTPIRLFCGQYSSSEVMERMLTNTVSINSSCISLLVRRQARN